MSTELDVAPDAAESTVPGWTIWPYRVAVTLGALMLFNQAVFAGQFLDGRYGALLTHRENATYAGIMIVVSGLMAIFIRWPGKGPWWPIAATFGLFALIGVQILLGFMRVIAIHIPLGVSIIVAASYLAVWAWRYRPASVGA